MAEWKIEPRFIYLQANTHPLMRECQKVVLDNKRRDKYKDAGFVTLHISVISGHSGHFWQLSKNKLRRIAL